MKKIAIVVGHTRTEPGLKAVAPIAQYEYFFNSDLAEKISMELDTLQFPDFEHEIFFRDKVGLTGTYKAVNEYGADACIELHFNGFDTKAHGTETLYGLKNSRSELLAAYIQSSMCQVLGRVPFNSRGSILIQNEKERGYWNVHLANCPSILIEPFFGDNFDDATLGLLYKEKLAVSIAGALVNFLKSGVQ